MSIENKLQTILNKVLEKKISIFATQNMKGLNDQVLIDDIEIKTELEKLFFENHRDAFYLKIDYNTSSHEIESRDGQEAYILAIDTKKLRS